MIRKLSLILAITCAGLAGCGEEARRSAPAGPGAVMPIGKMLPAAS